VGYSETSKAYQIFILGSWRIIVKSDVKFLEDKAYRKFKYLTTIDDQNE